MEQFKHRDAKSIPYWSPATKLSYADNETSKSSSNLIASAREFVPTFSSSSSSSHLDSMANSSGYGSEATGMNSSASEWRPPATYSSSNDYDEGGPGRPHAGEDPSPMTEHEQLPVYHTSEQEEEEQHVEVSA